MAWYQQASPNALERGRQRPSQITADTEADEQRKLNQLHSTDFETHPQTFPACLSPHPQPPSANLHTFTNTSWFIYSRSITLTSYWKWDFKYGLNPLWSLASLLSNFSPGFSSPGKPLYFIHPSREEKYSGNWDGERRKGELSKCGPEIWCFFLRFKSKQRDQKDVASPNLAETKCVPQIQRNLNIYHKNDSFKHLTNVQSVLTMCQASS